MFRNCFPAALLICLFTAVADAQGTGGRTPIFTGYTPVPEAKLQEGYVRAWDGTTTYGWKGNAKINDRKMNFTGRVAETPLYFLGYEMVPYNIISPNDMFKPTKMKSIFDGKTLTGWKTHGPTKAVVENETIRLTNGFGSLEYEGKYGDFVLQLEYKTDKPVNSGVFFRCIPGEMMNGYECQIYNKPPDEDYRKFIGTDTGGIFYHQVGRNVGAKDGVWNYLTIAARGSRMATWVNGIQVTDFDDIRAPHPNPRNGRRVEAGTIQLQGHDATTEIWFRNIRIREL
jgi:hypothetical protein